MVAVVTGAGSGIGMCSVAKLLLRDYVVIAWVKNNLGEVGLLENMARKNIRVHKLYIIKADFCEQSQLNLAISETKQILKKYGNEIDVFINCAGVYSQTQFKPKSSTDIHTTVNFLVPIQILNAFEGFLKNGSRAIFLFPSLFKFTYFVGKNSYTNFKKSYFNSKLSLAFYLENLAKSRTYHNIYLFLPRPSTTEFYTKQTTGINLSLGQVRKMFTLPPEYSAEQIVTIATRPEFKYESGGIYKDLKLVPQPKFMSNKKFTDKLSCLATIKLAENR